MGAFRVGDVVDGALGILEPLDIDISLFDDSAPEARRLLYASARSPGGVPAAGNGAASSARVRVVRTFDVAGRKWSIECTPGPGFLAGGKTSLPWVLLFAGVALTGLLAGYFLGRIRRTAAIRAEIAERKRAERAAALVARQWQETFDAISDAVTLLDKNYRIVRANRAARDLFRDAPLVGSHCYRLAHGTDAPPSACPAREAFRTGEPARFETQEPHLGNPWIDISASPLKDENGAVQQVVHIIHDITDLKEAEAEALRARRAAETANAAKSAFLANMSHEIRTPLTAILGYTELMSDPDQPESERQEALTTIRRNGEHLLSLINDILDLSKIEAGKLELVPRRCSLPAVVADVISLMRVRAEEGGISLSAEYTGPLPETILADPMRVRQVLVNLVGNATKFTTQGDVRIVTTFLPDGLGGSPAVRVEVVDTGIGIAPDDLERLCQPFTQADPSASRRHSGTGLGLTISRRLVELMDGTFIMKSQLGKGSTFGFIIPTGPLDGVGMIENPSEVLLRRSKTEEPEPTGAGALSGVRVLLAEDGADNQRLIGTILRKAGAQVTVVDNGRAAVDAALARTFDVILMDMQMPEMNGYEASTLLRNKGCSLPIIALTARAMVEDRDRCLSAGCTDYQTKPIDRAALIAAVAGHAGARRANRDDDAPKQPPAEAEDGLAILSGYNEDPDLADIIDQFVDGLAKQTESMRDALENGRFEELRREAHRLKGAGGSYGYPALTEAARVLETTAQAADADNAAAALAELERLCRAVVRGRRRCTASQEAKQ